MEKREFDKAYGRIIKLAKEAGIPERNNRWDDFLEFVWEAFVYICAITIIGASVGYILWALFC